MGAETPCVATVGQRKVAGKALLETTELRFRGEDVKVRIPLAEITSVSAARGVLDVRAKRDRLLLEIGPLAEKWLKKIKDPPTLLSKLGIKPGVRVGLSGIDDGPFVAELRAVTEDVVSPPPPGCDVIFLGAERRADLSRLARLREKLDPAGAIWVIRPKGKKEITEADVLAAGKEHGLVDVKVAAFSATHTAEKLVIPRSARPTR